jgi:hypothetical protein
MHAQHIHRRGLRLLAGLAAAAGVALALAGGGSAHPDATCIEPAPTTAFLLFVYYDPGCGTTTTTTYNWEVSPAYSGTYYADDAAAAAAEPPPPAPVTSALPTWRNLYDWPGGHGYAGWHSASSSQMGAYGVQAALGGQYGLWLWPVGGTSYSYVNGNYAEWTYAAPGTTRIQNATIKFTYRNKLLAHHCIDIGFRNASGAVVTHNEHCKPVSPPDSQRGVTVSLVDPSSTPSSAVLYIRIRVDCGGAASCSKNIPQHDPLVNGAYVRATSVDMTLTDGDLPVVTASDRFWDLGDQYSNGRSTYPLTVAASDAGSGIVRNWVERVGAGALAAANAPCDPTHHTDALDNRICPPSFSFSPTIDTNPFPEGANNFVAKSSDVAANVGATDVWTVYIDRTPPTAPSGFTLPGADADLGEATVQWADSSDPALADGSPGSGVAQYAVRYAVNGGAVSDWTAVDSSDVAVSGVTGGDSISIEAKAVDAVGNESSVGSATLTVPTVSTTRGPVLTGKLVNGAGEGVAGDVTISLANEDVGESAVAVADAAADGSFALKLTRASSDAVAAAARANGGWVNFDVAAGGNGVVYQSSIARKISLTGWSDGSGDAAPLQITLDPGAPGVRTNATVRRLMGVNRRFQATCQIFNYKIGEDNRYAPVGELHTVDGINGHFQYGHRADSDIQVGVSADGKVWKILGSVHVSTSRGTSQEDAVDWYRNNEFGMVLTTSFHFVKYERHLSCFGARDIVDYVVKAKAWNGGTDVGANIHSLDHHCLDTYPQYSLSFLADTGQSHTASKGHTWDRGVTVFGASLDVKTNHTKWVTTHWRFTNKHPKYVLCGNDDMPLQASRTFAGS